MEIPVNIYGNQCGWTLAQAHALSGNPATISGI
jgi:hypothetical protein